MAEKPNVPPTVVAANLETLRQVTGSTLHWDSTNGMRRLGPNIISGHEQRSSFQAQGALVTEHRGQRYWKTSEIRSVPALFLPIAWEYEAELATFSLDAVLIELHPDV